MINDNSGDLLDYRVITFIDDILIYVNNEEEHDRVGEEVLKGYHKMI
jgi:hypothetical protein